MEKNLKVFFENLTSVYDKLTMKNFPNVKLPIFDSTNLEVILYQDRETAVKEKNWPLEFFNLFDAERKDFVLEFRKRAGASEFSELSFRTLAWGKNVVINGKPHKSVGGRASGLDFIYHELPMFNYVYSLLEENLEKYFNTIREESAHNYQKTY